MVDEYWGRRAQGENDQGACRSDRKLVDHACPTALTPESGHVVVAESGADFQRHDLLS